MTDLEQERLERLHGWEADLKRLIKQAEGAGDTKVLDAAKAMLVECQKFISEDTGGDPSASG
jgi:hypothetical protein